ncbi:MAG: hypothetical protein GX122_00175 [Candidatus Cloacimonetes bacterium]|nr:hypothetical protein [Candidatus Cloacimonadota bacterium]
MPDKYRRYIPLGISAGLHLIVLIVMMLYYLPLMQEQPWYEVSWSQMSELEDMPEDVQEPEFGDIQVNLAQPRATTPKQPKQATPPANPNPTTQPATAPNAGPSHAGESDVMEAPVYSSTVQPNLAPPHLQSSPIATDALLRDIPFGIPSQGTPGSVSSDLEGGGKLFRADTKVHSHQFGDYGEVKLSFRVDISARLDPNSIRIVQSQSRSIDAEAIKILKDMSFGFRGRPEPDRTYTITIKFIP